VYHWRLDRPAQQEFAELSPAVQAAPDAVVIVDPIDYQHRQDEIGDPPLRTLHFGTNILRLFWENRGNDAAGNLDPSNGLYCVLLGIVMRLLMAGPRSCALLNLGTGSIGRS
jgi:hypothetical protein